MASIPAFALSVTTQAPGALRSLVATPAAETSLTVSGPVDASDLYFIAREMTALTALDLSDATISAYSGEKIAGRYSFPEATIPQHFFSGTGLQSVRLPSQQGLTVADGAFALTQLTTLDIPASVASVGDGAFTGCPQLTTVTFSAAKMGVGAFSACPRLDLVTIASRLDLPANAFADDAALRVVAGSDYLLSVGPDAFRGCTALTSFSFGAALKAVDQRAFLRSGLQKADLSACNALDSVGSWAFAECPSLTEANLAGAVTAGSGVVFMCPALTSFTPAADEIGAYTLAHNTAMTADGIIPDNIRVIGAHALHGLSQLTAITIPASVEEIGTGAMAGMTGLESIDTEATAVPALGEEVWRGVDQSKVILNVPPHTGADYEAAAQWQDFIIKDPAVAEITDAAPDGAHSLRGRFAGTELQLSITGTDIERITLHDPAGLLLIAVEPSDSFVAIDTAGFTNRVFIISAVLADGRTATLKLVR